MLVVVVYLGYLFLSALLGLLRWLPGFWPPCYDHCSWYLEHIVAIVSLVVFQHLCSGAWKLQGCSQTFAFLESKNSIRNLE